MITRIPKQALILMSLVVCAASPTSAPGDVVDTAFGSFCHDGVSPTTTGSFTFDWGDRTVFATTQIDLGPTVDTMTFVAHGNPLDQNLWYGSAVSDDPTALSFDASGLLRRGTSLSGSFIGDIDENSLTGTAAGALPSAAFYTLDGFYSFSGSFCFPPEPPGLKFDLNLGLNAFKSHPTPTGANVFIPATTTLFHPEAGVEVTIAASVTFASVGAAGDTTITAVSDANATVPMNFSVAIGSLPVVYFDVSTTASVSGPITVCASYPDADDTGLVDDTTVDESTLRLLHHENQAFVDRTDFTATNYDTNRICATVSSLSLFVRAVDLNAPVDTDGDGVPDDRDICPGGDDNANLDEDGFPDDCDICPNDFSNDADGDGVCGDVDVCPAGNDNHNQDGDLLPDACDVCPFDVGNDGDGDGICESLDNCPFVANSSQTDSDVDGIGDACDTDADNDTVPDNMDNCPFDANLDQRDTDGDGAGDVCDLDADGDNVLDANDACFPTALGAVVDATGCSIAQLCPCDNTWKNHGAYVSCVARAAGAFVKAGRLTNPQKDGIVSAAAASACGKGNR